ncbi:hypothetical protein IA539_12800 [Gordonia sp. zg691]|uniref:Integral membrane protein n=1 Tax=Gordonia jinghuaiqii TaxID=2758710 RepID=A0A7D7LW15_9ACTN|nr:hypothetical protein [Gordonia jinghuaiqii]MBD0862087.1 hypothetical protein [Gordonia jinghuaiqii]MCR5978687.1 hypothetical protein [Gordonia jinghuaiqii]QMT03001.1 hypothetical protein H1R19_07760 [Gordonia jinghuaiqii]
MAAADVSSTDLDLAELVGTDTVAVVVASGVILLWGLALGVWKYHGIRTSPDHTAHVYVDIAHRAALMYSFATLVLAALVELSDFSAAVNLAAAFVPIVFFVAAIAAYCFHGALRDTTNQFVAPTPGTYLFMVALIVGEIGGVLVLLAGVVARLM